MVPQYTYSHRIYISDLSSSVKSFGADYYILYQLCFAFQDNYKTIFDAMLIFLDSFDTYANFQQIM